jgi:hypothetical protein
MIVRNALLALTLIGAGLVLGAEFSSAGTSADPAHLHCSDFSSPTDQSTCLHLSSALADEGTHLSASIQHSNGIAQDQQTVSHLAHQAHNWDPEHLRLIHATLEKHKAQLQHDLTRRKAALDNIQKMLDIIRTS